MASLVGLAFSLLAPPLCWACGASASRNQPLCPRCRSALTWLGEEQVALPAREGARLWAPLAYEGGARALVAGLKYRGARGLAEPMAAQMFANVPRALLTPGSALVPVPLHPARRRSRGFNQAALLAAALGRRAGLEVCDCLRRSGSSHRQVGRGRSERLGAVTGTVSLRAGVGVPQRIVLVDDVATTGATLAACAASLHSAAEIVAVTYARTLGR